MNKYFNAFLIVFYSFVHLFIKNKCSSNGTSKENILLILDQPGVGDTVTSLLALNNFSMQLPKEYIFYIAAPKSVIDFLRSAQSTFGAKFIEIDYSQKYSLKIFKKNLKKLSEKKWNQVFSFNSMGSYIKMLLLGCNIHEIVGNDFNEARLNWLSKLLSWLLPNFKVFYFPYSTTRFVIFKQIVDQVLINLHCVPVTIQYNYSIPTLCENPLKKITKAYCIICPSISPHQAFPFRSWPLQRFVEIVNFILESSDYKICLCGTAYDNKVNDYILSHINIYNSSRIINLTGKTSFKEWIEVIRGAKFLFGNDSGYIHLAAFLKVPSFAIAGYWNYGRFLPYPSTLKEIALPMDIRRSSVSCAGCALSNKKDKTRIECEKSVREYGVYKCILDITVNYVKNVLIESRILN